MDWPVDYRRIFKQRQKQFVACTDVKYQIGAKAFYKDRPIDFINDWGVTYDPRNVARGLPTTVPFILFDRQRDIIDFLLSCLYDRESGLIEKTRDFGATWAAVGFSAWLFLFHPGASIGWGSRKENLVDRIGDPDSIFEKIRIFLLALPKWFLPAGFNERLHFSYMKIINPETGGSITGEAGDNIGRGGRKLIYFKDESAHYERPEKIEAALGDNTDVQIDISSVNGPGNIFHRRRQAGRIWSPGSIMPKSTTRILVLDWHDHPGKSQEWYEGRRAKAESEGLLHIFLQEVDRDYSSAQEGVLIPGAWVKAAIDADKKLGLAFGGTHYAGFDPFDEALDAHAMVARRGPILTLAKTWSEGDTGQATRKVVQICQSNKIQNVQFDSVGIGAGVKTEANRLLADKRLPKSLSIIPWKGSNAVLKPNQRLFVDDPNSIKNKDFYKNLKAQGSWQLRLRFERTFKAITQGEQFDPDELIAIPSTIDHLAELENELSQPVYTHDSAGRILINKKPAGTKSPNLFDATVMAFWPVPKIDLSAAVVAGAPAGTKIKRAA
jgi:phage terminase large subunit